MSKRLFAAIFLFALLTMSVASPSTAYAAGEEAEVTLVGDVLTIIDINGGASNNQLTITYAAGEYTITDSGGLTILTAIVGASGTGTATVTIPDTGVAGLNLDLLDGNDTVTVSSVQATTLSSGFTVAGGSGTDSVTLNATVNVGPGSLSISAETITINGSTDLDATGTGAMTLTADTNIVVNSGAAIGVVDGDLTLTANSDGTATGNFAAIGINNATIETTGSGNLTMTGQGGDGTANRQRGLYISNGAVVRSTASSGGSIVLNGTGGPNSTGEGSNGIEVDGATTTITTVDGNIQLIGQAGGTTGSTQNHGVYIDTGARVIASGAADIIVVGTGGLGDNNQHGVLVSDAGAVIQVATGLLSVTGTAGGATGVSGQAVRLTSRPDGLLATGSGNIVITGTAGSTQDGLRLQNADPGTIGGPTATGDITITADRIRFDTGAIIQSSGALTVKPLTVSESIGLGGGSGTLNLTDDELGYFQDGFSSITFGDATNGSGTVTVESMTLTDPLILAGGTSNDSTGTDITAPSVTYVGNVAPGASPGQLVVNGDFELAANSALLAELNGPTAVSAYDQVQVTGAVTLNTNAWLTPTLGYSPTAGDSFTIIDNDGFDSVAGTFFGLSEGATLLVAGKALQISYVGGDGNDVVLTVLIDSCFATPDAGLTVFSSADSSAVQLAIDAAFAFDEVWVAGTCLDTQNVNGTDQVALIEKDLILVGGYSVTPPDFSVFDPSAYTTILDANKTGRVISITGPIMVEMHHLTLQNGDATSQASGGGGAIESVGADVLISNTTVQSSTAVSGAGISNYEGVLILDSSTVISNSATIVGGGLHNYSLDAPAAMMVQNGSVIQNNVASDIGAGIFNEYGELSVTASTIYSNTLDGVGVTGGAGIGSIGDETLPGVVQLSDNTRIDSNYSANCGGGVFSFGTELTVMSSTIINNRAECSGGGIFADLSIITIDASNIHSNTAPDGAGIYIVDTVPEAEGSGFDSSLTIRNGSDVRHNVATFDGGGIYAGGLFIPGFPPFIADVGRWINVAIDNSTIYSNTADSFGGGLTMRDYVTTTISGSMFDNNYAGDSGGGVDSDGINATLMIANSIFQNNRVGYNGGGLSTWNTTTITGSQFLTNTAYHDGGGVSADGFIYVTIMNTLFAANVATTDDGGAFDGDYVRTTISGSTFRENQAGDDGGALDLDDDTTIENSWIVNNTSGISMTTDTRNGGGIDLDSRTLIITNTYILSNTSPSEGGGILADGDLFVTDSEVGNNSADFGGGVHNIDRATFTRTTVRQNTASTHGGGIFSNDYLTVTNSTIISNSADLGGGVYATLENMIDFGIATIDGTTIRANRATTNGGGLYNITGTTTLTNSTIMTNTVDDSGGGIYNEGELTIDNSWVLSNTASFGGAIFHSSGTASVEGGHLHENSATSSGGAVYNIATLIITRSTILSNTAPTGGAFNHNNATDSHITESCIVNNDHTGVLWSAGPSVTATDNWWGHASGPSGVGAGLGDSVSTNVDFNNFKTSAILGCPEFGNPNLEIVKSISAETAKTGDTITYTLTFTNTGDHVSRNVVISDSVPLSITGVTVVSSTFGTAYDGGSIFITQTNASPNFVWETSGLATGAGGIIQLVGQVASGSPYYGTTITNTAQITSTYDSDSANNDSFATLDVVQVTFGVSPTTVVEDGAVGLTYTFTRSGATTDPLTVRFNVGGTATFSTDYTQSNAATFGSSGTITIAAGQSTASVLLDPIADSVVELDETVVLTLTAGAGYDVATTDSVTGTITNDDSATITLSGGTAQDEGDSGTINYVFTGTLSAAVDGGVAVEYATNDVTATGADGDYVDNDGTLVFSGTANETQSITVIVNSDTKVEADETFSVTLGVLTSTLSPSISTAGSPQVGTITNDDEAVVTVADAFVTEGNSGTTELVFSVTLTNEVDVPVVATYQITDFISIMSIPTSFVVSGTATADVDFVAASGTITFSGTANETKLITATVNGELLVEADETLLLTVSPDPATESTDGRNVSFEFLATGTITNDDSAIVTLSGGVAKDEGDNGGTTTHTFTATLGAAVDGGVSVAYATGDGTATIANGDYVANSGILTFAGTLNETQQITVTVNGDNDIEADETFSVTLGALSNSPLTASISTAGSPQIGTITNDDTDLDLGGVTVTQNEGDSGTTTFTFVVSRTGNIAGANTVSYMVSGVGANPTDSADFGGSFPAGTISFAAGEMSQALTINVTGDTMVEHDEQFRVTIFNPARSIEINTSIFTGTITNDDSAIVTLSGGTAQDEGDSGTVNYVFTGTLSAAVDGGVAVEYATGDGTATIANGDYVANSGILTFVGTLNETQQLTVTVNGDNNVEPNETFSVTLGALSDSPLTASISTAGSPQIGTITNDDTDFTLVPLNLDQAEGDSGMTAFIFAVTRTGKVDVAHIVEYAVSGSGVHAADSADFGGTLPSGSVHFAANEISRTVTISVTGDNDFEQDETFNVILTLPSPRSLEIVTDTITGTIRNDDFYIFVPMIPYEYIYLPDLVVESVSVDGANATLVIKNIGTRATTDSFWVDLILNPGTVPTQVNDVLETLGAEGHVWAVTDSLAPGESLTLVSYSAYFDTGRTNFDRVFLPGDVLYAHIDSASVERPTVGGVYEMHEFTNSSYNNILQMIVP